METQISDRDFDREKIVIQDILLDERGDVKNQHITNAFLSTMFTAIVIICGALATFFAATNHVFIRIEGAEDAKIVAAALAFLTTVCGTFEKTFGFQKKATGYRDIKARFENMQLDLNRARNSKDLDPIYENIKTVRLLKIEIIR